MIEEEEVRMLRKEMIPRAQLMPFFDRPFFPQRWKEKIYKVHEMERVMKNFDDGSPFLLQIEQAFDSSKRAMFPQLKQQMLELHLLWWTLRFSPGMFSYEAY